MFIVIIVIITIKNFYTAAGSSGSPGLACDDGERIVHQENKDKMVNKDHPVIKDYLEIPYLSNEPLKENKENKGTWTSRRERRLRT